MNRPTTQQVQDAQTIGHAILEANNYDYVATQQLIRKMSITNIRRDGNTVVIETARPGIVIGHKGKTIDVLRRAFVNHTVEIVESFLWCDLMTPIDPNDF